MKHLNNMIPKRFAAVFIFLLMACLLLGFGPEPVVLSKPATTDTAGGLFASDELLQVKLTGKLKELMNDRESADPQLFPFRLSYTNEQGIETVIPVEVRTRGHFRRMKANCTYPPLLIKFPNQGAQVTTVFRNQKKLKLVMPCAGEEYIVREWLAYKIYNLITPKSFKARLVKIQLGDERNSKTVNPVYGILLEEEDQLAERNTATVVETKLRPQQTEVNTFLTMSVFQYLIGNTDWSVEYLQNIKLIAPKSGAVPMTVAYDFDHAGLVGAPYAQPAEELQLSSTRERRYRGYCMKDLSVFNPVLAEFNRVKADIYKLYTDCKFLDEKYIKSTLRYLDEFYATINNTKAWQRAFAYPCDKNGTGNVIIKGLKEE
jgi:hypothetical protein